MPLLQLGRMILRMRIGFAVLFVGIAITARASNSDVAAKGEALIQQAQDKTNIFALSSFRMDANVRIDNFGKPLDGVYSLLWNGPEQWREEITFPGYSEVQVGGKGVVFLKRSVDVLPYRISQLETALGFGSNFGVGRFDQSLMTNEKVKSVRQEKLAGETAECIKIVSSNKNTREVCVDPLTGLANRQKQGLIDAEFAPIGSKIFPRSISLAKDGSRIVEIHITRFEAGQEFSPDRFVPPAGAVSGDGCMNPLRGAKIKDVTPVYPQMAKIAHIQGVVATEALIDKNGAFQNLRIVSSDNPLLSQSALDAVKQWRYQPATCNGRPVDTEAVIEVRYWLQ